MDPKNKSLFILFLLLYVATGLLLPVADPRADPKAVLLKNGRPLRFFNADCHAGTAAVVASMVASRHGVSIVTQSAYQISMIRRQYPSLVDVRSAPSLNCPQKVEIEPWASEKIKQHIFDTLNQDPAIQATDAFICTFPSAMCEALFAFNKTVIFAPGLRFSFMSCSKEAWAESVRILRRAARSTSPRHFVAALSKYDAEYVNYFTGINPLPLYSSSRGYIPEAPFMPSRPEILVGPLALQAKDVAARGLDVEFFQQLAATTEFKFATAKDLYDGSFSLEQVQQHRAAVVLPYAVMSVGLTELYALGIPLFFPSLRLMNERPLLFPNDRTMTGRNKTYSYCGEDQTIVPEQDEHSSHPYSPESLAGDAKAHWLKLADFYHWPHITFFDSIADLEKKLRKADFKKLHMAMLEEVASQEAKLDQAWSQIADGMEDQPRAVPSSYRSISDFLPT